MEEPRVDPEPSATFPIAPVHRARPSRGLPLSVLITLGVGAIAFVAGLRFGSGVSTEPADLTPISPQSALPTPSTFPQGSGLIVSLPSTALNPGPAATPVHLFPRTLSPGTHLLVNPYADGDPVRDCARGCADYGGIIFTVPAGWTSTDGLVSKHLDQPGEVAFSAWTVDQVYADPCHWRESPLSPLDITIHAHLETGLVLLSDSDGGLANQALRGPRPRALTEVTLGGQIALRIDLSVPAELDIATCDLGEFRSWTEWGVVDGANSRHAPGQLDTVYMVDVDRRPLVIDASHMPATSKEDLAELEAVLASMIIE